MAAPFRFAPATPADAAAITETTRQGFETYRAFATPGWDPPDDVGSVGNTRERLGRPDVWALLARSAAGEPAGHVAFNSVRTSIRPEADDHLAHLWMLFVRAPYWGMGLATDLLGRATAEAALRGYRTMRLFTPADQARARRFYEREGWTLSSEPIDDTPLGLPVVEYRRPLG